MYMSSLPHLIFPDVFYQCTVEDFIYLSSLSHNIFPDFSTSARLRISFTWALFLTLYFLIFLPLRGRWFHTPELSNSSCISWFFYHISVRGCGFHVPELSFTSYISWCFYQCALMDLMYLRSLSLLIFPDVSTSASSLGRYVFGSEISYNKAPPRLPGLGC